MNNEILKSMKERNNAMKAKSEVYAIEDLLLKMLKCYFKNKLMNFENEKLSARSTAKAIYRDVKSGSLYETKSIEAIVKALAK